MRGSRRGAAGAMVVAALAGLAALAPQQVRAQSFYEGVRPSGMGTAFNAVGSGAGALYHNPAGIAPLKMYSVDGAYGYAPDGNLFNVSLMDSKSNPYVAAGVAYTYFFGRGEANEVSGHDIRLALAMPVLANRISVGVAGRLPIFSRGEVEFINHITLDAGVLFRVVDNLHLGLAGRNLIDVCEEASRAQCANLLPTRVGGGLAYGDSSVFLISFDLEVDLTSQRTEVSGAGDVIVVEEPPFPIVELGGEVFLAGVVPVRLGYSYSTFAQAHGLTVGAGYKSMSAGFDVFYRHDFDRGGFGWLGVGFSIPVSF